LEVIPEYSQKHSQNLCMQLEITKEYSNYPAKIEATCNLIFLPRNKKQVATMDTVLAENAMTKQKS